MNVPVVRVMLTKTVKLKLYESAIVNVKYVSGDDGVRVEDEGSDAGLGTDSDHSTEGTGRYMISHSTSLEVADKSRTKLATVEETSYSVSSNDGVDGGEHEEGVKINEDPAEDRENASDAST